MNQEKQPLVSVIITTYRNEALLPRAIGSVLHQTYRNLELIVVDDNDPQSDSRRATETVMAGYPSVLYLRHPENRNGAAARNTGIRAANGKYIAFLDNDDLYFSGHIAQCVEALERCPDRACVLCGVVKVCAGLCWEIIPAADGDLKRKLLFSETALGTGSNLFVSAEAVRALGGFDENFRRHQDVEFGLRLFAAYGGCSLNNVQIIKEMEGFSNAPDFAKFRDTKRRLWQKFRREIDGLPPQERNRYFGGQYSALLYTACKGGSREEIRWAADHLARCRSLTGKERLLVMLACCGLFPVYEAAKRAAKKCGAKKRYRAVTAGLPACDRALLDSVLNEPV